MESGMVAGRDGSENGKESGVEARKFPGWQRWTIVEFREAESAARSRVSQD